MPRALYFLCPDIQRPTGGLRVIYRHAEILQHAGIDAAVVHERPGFSPTWFDHRARVLYQPCRFNPNDILVFPELYARAALSIDPRLRKVMLVQAPYALFRGTGLDAPAPAIPYDTPSVIGNIVPSQDALDFMTYAFPTARVWRVRPSADPLFIPRPKLRQIAFIPAKGLADAEQILGMLHHRRALTGWNLTPIDNVPLAQAAQILGESSIYLHLAQQEGFGLPLIEAMACRCLVVGYHALGGREVLTPDRGRLVESGDVIALARSVEAAISELDLNPDAHADTTSKAESFVRETYSPECEQADVLCVYRQIIAAAGE